MTGAAGDRATVKVTDHPTIGSSGHSIVVTTAESRFESRKTLVLSLGLLLLTAGVLFFAGLGQLPLVEPDEGRNAEVGREMLVTGDWITPHFNGLPYLDKPVVYFWMVAASFKTFGISESAARLPSALMAAMNRSVACATVTVHTRVGGLPRLNAALVRRCQASASRGPRKVGDITGRRRLGSHTRAT